MFTRKTGLVFAVGLTLAGCNLAPKYARPGLPVPVQSPTGPAYGVAGSADVVSAETAWESFFTDDRLRGVIRTALANNRDLRISVANVEQARAQYRIQRADLFPTLAGTASATYAKSPFASLGTPETASGRTDIYSANLGISAWEIDLFGRIRNLTRAQQEQYFAAAENRNAAQSALIAETATAWLTMAADQDRLQIARNTEKAFGETLKLTEARFRIGVSSELEVRQARTTYDQARSDIANATTLIAQDQNALNLLAGTTLSADLLPGRLPITGATLANLPANLPSEVLLRRPDVVSAEHQLIAANANIGAARAAFFPNISLTAALGTISLGLSNLFASGSGTWSVAPSVSQPLFDFGRNQGNLRYAKATRDALLATYERSIQSAFREVGDALARRGTITSQLEAQTSLRDNAAGAYRLADLRFRAGIDPFLTTLDSQRQLYTAEQSLLATRLTRDTNSVELYRALGGGLR
ncbi:efflux transporter outer membrane subunit (plasmid) [Sphingomonas paeninsulae]|jgi:multidrug efflux system outer membrane protein|uniref:Efflux transporter outer membrane subunit n=1 Tax=Sphingomonas paeninsulae TaxID=2319844 RepID=A0A494TDP1_SPHPE|nr:efflux transporter outer membrane subunit [Sphingomonas paeninsulae]AYJ85384.1 efflux transporter outer membrane subunit [Sphingomonas paeninsulae]